MILTKEKLEAHAEVFEIPTACFYCGKRILELPLVMWQGAGSQIHLHVICSQQLAFHLDKDAQQAYHAK